MLLFRQELQTRHFAALPASMSPARLPDKAICVLCADYVHLVIANDLMRNNQYSFKSTHRMQLNVTSVYGEVCGWEELKMGKTRVNPPHLWPSNPHQPDHPNN